MEDYAPHRKTHVAERDFVLRVAEDKVRNEMTLACSNLNATLFVSEKISLCASVHSRPTT